MSEYTTGHKPFYKLWWFWLIVLLVVLTAVGSVGAALTSDKGNDEDIVAGIDVSPDLASSAHDTGDEYDNLEEDIVSQVEKDDEEKAADEEAEAAEAENTEANDGDVEDSNTDTVQTR